MPNHKYSQVGRLGLIDIIDNLEKENGELRAQLRDMVSALVIHGWWCLHCDIFNGEEKEKRESCRHCEKPKPAPIS